ncbi:hypothetical protein LCGC14_3011370, partial [marine sediment metagenome]
MSKLLTSKQAAEYLCISERKLWSLTNSGDIVCVRVGRRVFYATSDLADFVERHR